jgi:hypothetical protein
MLTAADLSEKATMWLAAASDWKAKGDVGQELGCLRTGLEYLLGIAVAHHDSAAAGASYLREKHAGELLERVRALNASLLQETPAVAHVSVTFAHMAWLLGQHALGDAILQIICNAEVAKYSPPTKFWADYHRAMACLVARAPYVPQLPPKLKGYQKHWEPYLRVVAALTAGRDTAPALGACVVSFTRRNRDRRLSAAIYDGDGHFPVRWDFRLPSILGRWRAGS